MSLRSILIDGRVVDRRAPAPFSVRWLPVSAVFSGSWKPATDLRNAAARSRQLHDGLRIGAGRLGGLRADFAQHLHVARDVLRALRLAARALRDVLHQAGDLVGHLFDLVQRGAGVLGQQRAADHVGGGALHGHHRLVGVGLDACAPAPRSACVALAARSASRCTSSATTAKPRPASPAIEAWMEAFSARMLVCSAMSLISSTMLPISCELSPSRLMRLLVSWMVSRMAFMPSMVRRTASPPLCAMSTECRATSDERSALPDTSSVSSRPSGRSTRWPGAICLDCALAGLRQVRDSACVWRAAPSSWMAECVDGRDQLAQRLDRDN